MSSSFTSLEEVRISMSRSLILAATMRSVAVRGLSPAFIAWTVACLISSRIMGWVFRLSIGNVNWNSRAFTPIIRDWTG